MPNFKNTNLHFFVKLITVGILLRDLTFPGTLVILITKNTSLHKEDILGINKSSMNIPIRFTREKNKLSIHYPPYLHKNQYRVRYTIDCSPCSIKRTIYSSDYNFVFSHILQYNNVPHK